MNLDLIDSLISPVDIQSLVDNVDVSDPLILQEMEELARQAGNDLASVICRLGERDSQAVRLVLFHQFQSLCWMLEPIAESKLRDKQA